MKLCKGGGQHPPQSKKEIMQKGCGFVFLYGLMRGNGFCDDTANLRVGALDGCGKDSWRPHKAQPKAGRASGGNTGREPGLPLPSASRTTGVDGSPRIPQVRPRKRWTCSSRLEGTRPWLTETRRLATALLLRALACLLHGTTRVDASCFRQAEMTRLLVLGLRLSRTLEPWTVQLRDIG